MRERGRERVRVRECERSDRPSSERNLGSPIGKGLQIDRCATPDLSPVELEHLPLAARPPQGEVGERCEMGDDAMRRGDRDGRLSANSKNPRRRSRSRWRILFHAHPAAEIGGVWGLHSAIGRGQGRRLGGKWGEGRASKRASDRRDRRPTDGDRPTTDRRRGRASRRHSPFRSAHGRARCPPSSRRARGPSQSDRQRQPTTDRDRRPSRNHRSQRATQREGRWVIRFFATPCLGHVSLRRARSRRALLRRLGGGAA